MNFMKMLDQEKLGQIEISMSIIIIKDLSRITIAFSMKSQEARIGIKQHVTNGGKRSKQTKLKY